MIGAGDFAKVLYWGCVIWPLVSVIGVFACHEQKTRIRCHVAVSLMMVMITVASFLTAEYFSLSMIWNYDALTRFFRVMIAVGSLLVTLSMKFWMPRQLYAPEDRRKQLFNLGMIHLLVGISMLGVGINNFFVAILVLFVLVFLLMAACFLNGGGERMRAGWDYFRYMLLYMIIAMMGVFILGMPLSTTHLFLNRFGSFMVAFGIILATGVFPAFIPFMRLMVNFPVMLGGMVSFLVPLDFFTLFIRLYQIPGYQAPRPFLLALVGVGILIVLLKEKEDPFLLSVPLLVSLLVLAGVFADHGGGIYSACLLVMAMVFFVSVGYVIDRGSCSVFCKSWFMLVLSGFPPFGFFMACSGLVSYLILALPWAGYGLLGVFFVHGYLLLHKRRMDLFSRKVPVWERYCLMVFVLLPTVIMPVLAVYWLPQVVGQFTQN